MTIPGSLVYTPLNTKTLKVGPVIDSNTGDPITGATVTATLRTAGANSVNIAPIIDVPLQDDGAGVYSAEIEGESFNPSPGANYITVIDMVGVDHLRAHWEIPSTVRTRTH